MNSLQEFARRLLTLRAWSEKNLPLYGSNVSYELVLCVLANGGKDRAASLKHIYSKLPYSESNIRRYLRMLETDGWIRVSKDNGDMRNHVAEPTERLLRAFEAFAELNYALGASSPNEESEGFPGAQKPGSSC